MLDIVHWSWGYEARAEANAGRWSDQRMHADAQLRFGQLPKIIGMLRDLPSVNALGLSLVHVATVDTHDLSEAYRLTNSIERPWMHNTGVTSLVGNARSTSCGDLIRRPPETGEGPGVWVVVAAVGFQELPTDLNALLDDRFRLGTVNPAEVRAPGDALPPQSERPRAR